MDAGRTIDASVASIPEPAGAPMKAELIVLVLALLLVVAAFNISSLSSRTRSALILLALVASGLAWLHH